MARLANRTVRRAGRAKGMLVVLTLGVASVSLISADLDGKDPSGIPSGSVEGFKAEALEYLGGSEQVVSSNSSGLVGSAADSRSPSIVSGEQVGEEKVSSSEGLVQSAADSRSPTID